MWKTRISTAVLLLAVWGCGADAVAPVDHHGGTKTPGSTPGSTPPGSADDAPHFLRPAPAAPAIANPVVTFWAKKGEDRQALMYYHLAAGETDSTVFVRFRVRPKSLDRLPDGTPIQNGDSVLITLTLVDPDSLVVDFQPAGLRFSTHNPADLKLSYLETDPDVNDDGAVDAADTALTAQFRIWRQETPGAPWAPQTSAVTTSEHEVETDVFGFTRYGIAY